MSRLSINERKPWMAVCDRYDQMNDFATWFDMAKMKSVRYSPITTECALYHWRGGHWDQVRQVPVHVHDPREIKALAERELA